MFPGEDPPNIIENSLGESIPSPPQEVILR